MKRLDLADRICCGIASALICIAVLGSFIPQKQPAAFYIEAFPAIAPFLLMSGFNDAYNSSIFNYLLLLLSLALAISSFHKKLPAILMRLGLAFISLGLYLSHSALAFALTAALAEGETFAIPSEPHRSITLENIHAQYQNGTLADYVSEITVKDKDQEDKLAISVNKPAKIWGLDLLQSGYGFRELSFSRIPPQGEEQELDIDLGLDNRKPIINTPDTGIIFMIADMHLPAIIDDNMQPASAEIMQIYPPDSAPQELGELHPGDSIAAKDGSVIKLNSIKCESAISISRDPGFMTAIIGFALIFIGTLAYLFKHRGIKS
ncbi:MAG: cytochrome c biogenesis protein ResB [bacterium]|nr:cytochrome c biogenesis protein ResB [bacterium]